MHKYIFNGIERVSEANFVNVGQIVEDEFFRCLNTLPNQKSPGTDGLSAEWSNVFGQTLRFFC